MECDVRHKLLSCISVALEIVLGEMTPSIKLCFETRSMTQAAETRAGVVPMDQRFGKCVHDSSRWKMIVISKHRQRPGTSSIYVILSSTWYTLLLFKNSFSFFILRQIAVIVLYIRNVHSEKRVTFWNGRGKMKKKNRKFRSSVVKFIMDGLSYSSVGSSSSRQRKRNTLNYL